MPVTKADRDSAHSGAHSVPERSWPGDTDQVTDLVRHLKRVQQATAVIGVAVGCFLGLIYFTLTANQIAPGMRVFVWQIPAAGALIGTSTRFLARALSMQRPLGRWLVLQAATILVVFAGFAATTG
jgi:hypothetical protein